MRRDLHEANRWSWNAATAAHNTHKGDQAHFFREGGSTLHREELELLGDLPARSVLHLQCNSGQDTLSLARLGATVTGVDISDTAIEFARQLSAEAGIPATFHRADVYDWLAEAAERPERYDVVFSSYGALCWLSDLKRWAAGIAAVLAPGGRLVVVDFHPVWMMFDDDWALRYPYSGFDEDNVLLADEGVGDYVAFELRARVPGQPVPGVESFQNPHPAYEFCWGLGDIVTAILDAGLRLEALREYPASPYTLRPGMRLVGDRWYPPEAFPPMPLLFGIRAVRLPQ
ncbi:class I SAM-dependent methyltransferase [Thermomicrobiaceae bacterium CFH 74404]|uniref:Class I SAM-dependent methyltransferase n=1 Tax=Thermalbibacter longus TaxID=2951981 RepID=A0AA41WAB7_9BACT|nr:class I SAM-dependent methyltransferase [Thermalbibacter longus]MCM8748526.1 class I SAM-dependent methyltransferase [Thermalbibacter longus]